MSTKFISLHLDACSKYSNTIELKRYLQWFFYKRLSGVYKTIIWRNSTECLMRMVFLFVPSLYVNVRKSIRCYVSEQPTAKILCPFVQYSNHLRIITLLRLLVKQYAVLEITKKVRTLISSYMFLISRKLYRNF